MDQYREQTDLATELKKLAQRWPGQVVGIVFDGETYQCGVLSLSDLAKTDWMVGPVTLTEQVEDRTVSLAL